MAQTYTPLQPGQQPTIGTMGQSVADLQQQLNAQHAGQPGWVPLVVDSKFGPKTQAAMNFKPLQTGQQQTPTPAPQQQSPTTLQGYTQGLQQMQSQGLQAYNDYKRLVDRINTGKIPLTPQQKVLLKGIEESFNSAAQQQEIANKSLNQAVTQSGATSGLQRYNPAEAAAQVNLSVSQGIQKVNDIHTEMNMKIAEMKQQFQDNNLKAARDAYNDYLDLQKQQYSYMKDIYDTTYQYNKDLRDFNLRQQEFNIKLQEIADNKKYGKPLSADAAKVLAFSNTLQTSIPQIKAKFGTTDESYKKAIRSYITGSDRELVKLIDNAADSFGRMRSGGAINKDEADRFKNQIISSADLLFGTREQADTAINSILTEAQNVSSGIDPSGAHSTVQTVQSPVSNLLNQFIGGNTQYSSILNSLWNQ